MKMDRIIFWQTTKNTLKQQCFPQSLVLLFITELLDSEANLRIDEALDDDWESFDEDLHCEGNFLAWEMDQTLLQEEIKNWWSFQKAIDKKEVWVKNNAKTPGNNQ